MFLSLNIWVTLLRLTNDEHDDKDVLRDLTQTFWHAGSFRVLYLLKLYFFEHFVFVFMV